MNQKIEKGMLLKVVNINPLEGNTVAPPLELEKEYPAKNVTFDSENNPHIDVGLKSKFAYIRSHETKEELPNGDKIHWCHPSRFEIVPGKTNDAMQFIEEDSQ